MKPRPSSQVIVDPQELTQFLRGSQDFSELGTNTLQIPGNDNGKVKPGIQLTPKTQPRPMSSFTLSPQRRSTTPKKGWKRYVGIPLAITSGFLFTMSFILVKKLFRNFHPISLAFWQFGIHFLLSIPFLIYFQFVTQINVFQTGWNDEVVRVTARKKVAIVSGIMISCLSGVTVLVLQFLVLKYLQVGDATIIAFSGSLFTVGFGHFFLYEKCGFVTIPISCFILFGIFLMTRPPFLSGADYDVPLLIGISLALLTAVLASAYLIAMRKLRKVHVSLLLFVSGGLGLVECGIVAGAIGVKMIPDFDSDIGWVLTLGILTFVATGATLVALKYEEAGVVNLTRMMDVIFSFVLQYIFLQDIPDQFSLFGATIVLTGVSIIGLRSILLTLPAENQCRRFCCCLLK